MDMFYTDADGLILEHWDTIAPFAPKAASGADMVGGTACIDRNGDTAANKSHVLEFTKQIRQERRFNNLAKFVAEDLVQHAPGIENGLQGLERWLTSPTTGHYEMLFQLIGDGDFVMTYGKRHAEGRDFAVFDLYRLADGKIVEQWMNEEEIGPRETWGNSGKF